MRRLDVTPHGSTAPEGRDPSPIPSGSSITKAEFAYCCFSAPFDVATFGEGELQEFRLAVESGTALFDTIEVVELVSP